MEKKVLEIVPSNQIFKDNITMWVLLDTQLKTINEKTKKMREKKVNYQNTFASILLITILKTKSKSRMENIWQK